MAGSPVHSCHFAGQCALWVDETKMMLRMQFAARLHPLQRATVELHDTSREMRCDTVQRIQSSDPRCSTESQSVSQSATRCADNRAIAIVGR